MAWSESSLDADELTAFSADRPCMFAGGASRFRNTHALPQWNKLTGSFAEANAANTDRPAWRVIDGNCKDYSGTSSTSETWYLLFELDTTEDFDSVAIFHDHASGVTVSVEIADDLTFSTNLQEIASGVSLNAYRHAFWVLASSGSVAKRFSGTAFGRLKFTGSPAWQPRVAEVFWGRRRQLLRGVGAPSAKSSYVGGLRGSEEPWGTNLPDHKGKLSLSAPLVLVGASSGENDADTVKSLLDETRQGSRPFVWNDAPSTSPHNISVMTSRPTTFLGSAPYVYRGEMALVEQPPFLVDD